MFVRRPRRFLVRLALGLAAFLVPAALLTSAWGAPLRDAQDATAVGQPARAPAGAAVTGNRMPINQRFPDLDAYLAYLEKRSHINGSWYREVRPGVYALQTGNLRLPDGGKPQRTFTREELEKKFGFSR